MAQGMQKAKAALEKALEEAWEKFEHAVHETLASESAGITLFVRFKPGKETEKTSIAPKVEVGAKMNLPTNKATFTARDSGGQLSLSSWDE